MEHPCGSLPVYGLHVSLYYCPQHFAWWCHNSAVVDDAPSTDYLLWQVFHGGPFDTPEQVLEIATSRLKAMMLDRQRPWGSVDLREHRPAPRDEGGDPPR